MTHIRRNTFTAFAAGIAASLALLLSTASAHALQTPPTPRVAPAPAPTGASTKAGAAGGEMKPQQLLDIVSAVTPSLVRVEITLQYDKGDAPDAAGWAERCPSCGRFHGSNSSEDLVKDERPMEVCGFLTSADTVVTVDPIMHPRFIKSIAVRQGDTVVPATLKGILKDRPGMVLTLGEPLKSAKPLAFDAALAGPYYAITYAQGSADWVVRVEPASTAIMVGTGDRKYTAAPSYSLITNGAGKPVGLCTNDRLDLDGSWKGSPNSWAIYTTDQMEALRTKLTSAVDNSIARVTLTFRSPKANPGMGDYMRYNPGGGEEDATVRHANGVLVDDNTVLVLIDLKGKQTARLERIQVHIAGKEVDAKFDRTLKDYGGLIATLATPVTGAVVAANTANVQPLRDVVLPTAELLLQGDKRTPYYSHRRIPGFSVGYKRQHQPDLPSARERSLFIFNDQGELVVVPISRRVRGDSERYSYRGGSEPAPMLVGYLWPAIHGDAATYADASNVPLSETEENRLAWLGVELQPLTPDLARENGVSDQTSDGDTGAMVTYIYPNSPAAKAGIEVGQILLRIHSAEVPKPIDVQASYGGYGDMAYPWDRFDELPEAYFDRVPAPWPMVENEFTRALTDLGFGKKVELEFAADGKVTRKEFDVEEGPGTFESATKYKFEPLGVTVKDLTYEVRRYFQIPEGEPGLIIGKIEIGSKASTSGLKPYELITHVNDQPVTTVKEFEEKVKGADALRLSIRRMHKSRQVNISLDAPEAAKPDAEAAKPEDAPAEPEKNAEGDEPKTP